MKKKLLKNLFAFILSTSLFNVPTDFLLGRDDYLQSIGVWVDVLLDVALGAAKSNAVWHEKNLQNVVYFVMIICNIYITGSVD